MDYNVVTDDAPDGMSALEIASSGQRLGAFLVDFVISVLVGIVGMVIGSAMGGDGNVVQLRVFDRLLDRGCLEWWRLEVNRLEKSRSV